MSRNRQDPPTPLIYTKRITDLTNRGFRHHPPLGAQQQPAEPAQLVVHFDHFVPRAFEGPAVAASIVAGNVVGIGAIEGTVAVGY